MPKAIHSTVTRIYKSTLLENVDTWYCILIHTASYRKRQVLISTVVRTTNLQIIVAFKIGTYLTWQIQALPDSCNFELRKETEAAFRRSEKWNNNNFERRAKFFVEGMKVECDGGGGWMGLLLDGNAGGGRVVLRPLRLQCVGVWISTGISCVNL